MKSLSSQLISVRGCKPLAALITTLALAATLKVQAASQTWTNAPGSGTWNIAVNWNSKAIPGLTNVSGNTVNADIATFTNALSGGIGGAGNPILTDDATLAGTLVGTTTTLYRSREIAGITFDGPSCGAYVVSTLNPPVYSAVGVVQTGILVVSHNGAIRMNGPVANNETVLVPMSVILPSSTAGIFNLVNNSANNSAAMIINSITHGGATSRATTFILDGTNTANNVVTNLSEGAGNATGGLTKQGTGTWILAGPNTFPGASPININAGTLIVQDPGVFGVATTPTVNSNGVLQLNGVTLNQAAITLKGGTLRANGSVTANGVTIGTALGTVATLATTSASDLFSIGISNNKLTGGVLNGSVLHVTGPGTVSLLWPANYVGAWSVDAGTNQVANATGLGTGAYVNIAAGATLDTTPVTAGSGSYTLSTTALSASGIGTGVSAAVLNADPSGSINLYNTPNGNGISLTFTPASLTGDLTHPALVVPSGTLILGNNAFSINNAGTAALGNGTYTLIQAGSTITDNSGYSVTAVTGQGVVAGSVASIVVSGTSVNLVISPYVAKSLVWSGTGSAWDIATSSDWLNGVSASIFNNSDNVTFNAVGAANPTVALATTLAPGSVTVNNTATYTFNGGAIAGGASLLKNGSGTLVLNEANSYGGGTVINNGIIKLGIANAIPNTGTGNLTIANPGILDMNGNNNAIDALVGSGTVDDVAAAGAPVLDLGYNDRGGIFSGSIQNTTGTLGLSKEGNGIQVLTASNSFAGPTTVNAGTLAVSNYNALGTSAVTLNNGTLDLRTSLLVASIAGTSGTIANNSTANNNQLVVGASSTFNGVIADGSGGGQVSVLVSGGTLQLNGNDSYSGGTILAAGTTLGVGSPPGTPGTGGIIVSNLTTIASPNHGSASSSFANNITTVDGATVWFTSGSTLANGTVANTVNGQFFGSALATNVFQGDMSLGGALSFSNFLGTAIFTNAGTRMFNAVCGGDNTTFDLVGTGGFYVRDPDTMHVGALTGNGAIYGPTTVPGTYWIGAKNVDSEFSGSIGYSNNIVKTGTGRLTLDGAPYSINTDSATFTNLLYTQPIVYVSSTTVSNGVLALSAPNNLNYSPSITLAGTGAVLDMSNAGYVTNFLDGSGNSDSALITNSTLEVLAASLGAAGTPQSLYGFGTLTGNLLVDVGGTVTPGLPTGQLNVSGTAEIAGAVNMNLSITNSPVNSEIAAPTIKIDSTATLVVTNVGPGLYTGTTFQLFSRGLTGAGFASVTLPATDPTGLTNYVWANNLTANGSITLTSGGLNPVANYSTNIIATVNGSLLTITWPATHLGWELMAQTNTLTTGLGNNWVTNYGTASVISTNFTIDPANGAVFYRLVHP